MSRMIPITAAAAREAKRAARRVGGRLPFGAEPELDCWLAVLTVDLLQGTLGLALQLEQTGQRD
jgi:hypothetical protein